MSLFLIKIKMFWNLPAARESDSNKEWRIEMRDADWPRGKTDDESFTTSMEKILREEKLMNFCQKWYFCETFFAKIEGPNCSKVKFSRKGGLVEQKGTVMGGLSTWYVRVNLGMITCPVRFENTDYGRSHPNCDSQFQNHWFYDGIFILDSAWNNHVIIINNYF